MRCLVCSPIAVALRSLVSSALTPSFFLFMHQSGQTHGGHNTKKDRLQQCTCKQGMSESAGKGQKLERDKEGASLESTEEEDGPANTWILETRDNTFCFLSHSTCVTSLQQLEENTVGYRYYVATRLLEDRRISPVRHPLWVSGALWEPREVVWFAESHEIYAGFILLMTSWKQNHELSPASLPR